MAELIGIFLGAAKGGLTNFVVLVPAIVIGLAVSRERTALAASVALNGLLFGFASLFLVGDEIKATVGVSNVGLFAVWLGGMFAALVATYLTWNIWALVKRRRSA